MSSSAPAQAITHRPSWGAFVVIGLAVAVLGGTLVWSAFALRERIRSQIVQRDGEILDAVTLMQHLSDQAAGDTIAPLDNPGEQFQLALKVSKLRNVLGVRLYDADGKFLNAFPAYITDAALLAGDLAQLSRLKPVSHYSAHSRMEDQDLLAETNNATAALLLVEVPLRAAENEPLVGVIQFLTDGSSIARQYARLDRALAWESGITFGVGATVLAAGLGLALGRVQRANRKLAERTGNLLQANRELALAARTSAVGAVASHLIHGLKNPVSGLRQFVHTHNEESGNGSDSEWQAALSTTQRMEELINQVVRVLQEQQSGVEYEISVAELAEMLERKARPRAIAAAVRCEIKAHADRVLTNREADLILLILENLIQNAIEATPPGKTVEVRIVEDSASLIFEVHDQGPGLPLAVASRLFMPCASAKQGGGGIGLAISNQMAQSFGAKLELEGSTTSGCTFRLTVPLAGDARSDRLTAVKSVIAEPAS